ncbi:MAG: 2Fe-2S iron-sulfur cluster-binding protein [Rhodocyclaceae bacterium]|nr:2Fe-2S iron-sulfur cluster-binding protein [Rhodocyclaceae bacterium]MDZ4214873.1 2Fe-2S iron-sulfur cluster-binding protein [Rhodocyclaceae bacterium]
MSQRLSLSRAAHLIGTTRAALQKQIASGELVSSDGTVSTAELQALYPDLRIEDSGAFERITQIRDEAFGKRIRERVLPNQEILAQRLALQSEELEDVRRHLAHYHDMIEALRERIEQMSGASAAEQIAELADFLDVSLARVLGSEEPTDTIQVMDNVLRVMSAHVTVKPSGHEFFVEGSETVLQAALRAGLAPSYGCGNGNCGLCKARIIAGQTQQVQQSDYPLSASERTQGYALLCSHTAVSDLVIEMLEANAPEDIPQQEIVAKVRSVAALTPNIMLLHLQTPRSSRLRFLAGQRVALSVTGSTANFRGEYAIASCPCDDRNVLLHVCHDEEDAFASRLFAGAIRANDAVSLFGPFGDFVLQKDSPNDSVFVVCDSGFAPVKSLIEHAVASDLPGALRLIWAATRADGHYLENQCRAWADVIETFSYITLLADSPGVAGAQAAARALAEEDIKARDVYVVGPSEFVEAAHQRLVSAGLPAAQLRVEVL